MLPTFKSCGFACLFWGFKGPTALVAISFYCGLVYPQLFGRAAFPKFAQPRSDISPRPPTGLQKLRGMSAGVLLVGGHITVPDAADNA